MKKLIALTLSLLMICALFCACGKASKPAGEEYGVLGAYLSLDEFKVDTDAGEFNWKAKEKHYLSTLPDTVTIEGIEISLGMTYQELCDAGLTPSYDDPVYAIGQAGTVYTDSIKMVLPSGKDLVLDLRYDAGETFEDIEDAKTPTLENGVVSSIEMDNNESYEFEYDGFSNATSLDEFFKAFKGTPYYADQTETKISMDYFTADRDNFCVYFTADGSGMTCVRIFLNND